MRFFEKDTDRHVIVYIQVYNAISSKSQTETLIFFTAQGHILGTNLAPHYFFLSRPANSCLDSWPSPSPSCLSNTRSTLPKSCQSGRCFVSRVMTVMSHVSRGVKSHHLLSRQRLTCGQKLILAQISIAVPEFILNRNWS